MLNLLWAILLCASLACGWLLTLLGMPGNWLMVLAAVIYSWAVPPDARLGMSNTAVITLAGLAIAGEVIELAAGALGVAKVGGSRRSGVLALVGSVIGGVIGMGVGLPVPIIGSMLAAVFFAGLGALGGAMLGEQWKGRGADHTWQVGKAAFWGRIFGTLAKTIIASVMVGVGLAALILHGL